MNHHHEPPRIQVFLNDLLETILILFSSGCRASMRNLRKRMDASTDHASLLQCRALSTADCSPIIPCIFCILPIVSIGYLRLLRRETYPEHRRMSLVLVGPDKVESIYNDGWQDNLDGVGIVWLHGTSRYAGVMDHLLSAVMFEFGKKEEGNESL
ncbi:hypothetical protein ACH5RR_016514 [Cinchona calisaya]|uniref:Uncharacterized protein n=1 Tax=Cinchona calisaya TaxID=153742 RepID=A0ABD2ZZK9_9GENT